MLTPAGWTSKKRPRSGAADCGGHWLVRNAKRKTPALVHRGARKIEARRIDSFQKDSTKNFKKE